MNTILYTDRSAIMRTGFNFCLKRNPELQAINLQSYAKDHVILKILEHRPTLVFLDYTAFVDDLNQLVNLMKDYQIKTKIILICEVQHLAFLPDLKLQQQKIGVIMRDATFEEFERATKHTSIGKTYYGQMYTETKSKSKDRTENSLPQKSALFNKYKTKEIKQLTNKERQVMRLISGGLSTASIANELCLSTRTIDAHRMKILKKLCLKGKTALLHYALEHKSFW